MSDDPEQVAGEGDIITVGAISNAEGIAIGRNARVEIRRYGDVIVRVDTLEDLPPTPGKEPYKGLTYYTEDDRDIFFGRERLSDDLAARLETTAFLLVAGASGSGKSSLLRAGVIPRLRQRNWLIRVLTPSADPLRRLAENLTPAGAARDAVDGLRDELAADPRTLRHAAEQLVSHAASARLLLVVDQFEELFTQCRDEPARRAFIDNLLAAAHDDGRITVLIGLRADFTGRLAEVEALRARAESNFILLGPMQQEDLVRVIAEPARIGGWAFVDGLVEQFLRDAGQEPGRLPLLSHALLETWKRRSSHVMTLKGYREAGGVDGAIARTAEDTLERLTPQARPIAQTIFLALTELGEGAEDTRRVARRDELARAGDPAAVDGVLNTLAAARLVMIDDKGVQVAHEALIRRWPRLREWLADSRQRLRFERQLEEDAQEWEAFNRDPGALYRGARLAQAREWRAGGRNLSERGEEFLAASAAEEEREAAEREAARRQRERLTRRAFVGLSALAALAVLAAFIAFFQRNEAIAASGDAQSRLLQNLSENVFESDPLPADRLLLEAVAAAGSDAVAAEAAGRMAGNLLGGRVTDPITGTVDSFTGVHTDALYVVDYRLGKDGLISGATGAAIPALGGDVFSVIDIPDSPFFVVDYFDAPDELRRADDARQAVPLGGRVYQVLSFPDSAFFIVGYEDAPGELRRANDGEPIATLGGQVEYAYFIPDSPFAVVYYSDAPPELRRTDDGERIITLDESATQVFSIADGLFFVVGYEGAPGELRRMSDGQPIAALSGVVTQVIPIPDSPFFVVGYDGASDELRRTDDAEQIVTLSGTAMQVVPIPGGPFFVVIYDGAPDELRRTDDAGLVIPLNGDVFDVTLIPDSPFFITHSSGAPSELRRTDDPRQIIALGGEVSDVFPIPGSPFFVTGYFDGPGELRRTDNLEKSVSLNGDVVEVYPIPGSPFYVISYFNAPGELRRTDDEEQIVALSGTVINVGPVPDGPFFFIEYFNAPTELRRADTGDVVTDESGRRVAGKGNALDDDRGLFLFGYQDGTSEIVSGGRALVDLGRGVVDSLYFPETGRVAVRYGDGRVVYIDLNLIEAIGGPDGQATLAAMSPDELVAFACDLLFTDNPEWDEARLDEYLAFLPEGRARACGGN